jgi:hypothetical protein
VTSIGLSDAEAGCGFDDWAEYKKASPAPKIEIAARAISAVARVRRGKDRSVSTFEQSLLHLSLDWLRSTIYPRTKYGQGGRNP